MPKVEVPCVGSWEVEEGIKLVHALEENGIDILHRCGGNARCVSCRVEIIRGDPGLMGEREYQMLKAKGLDKTNIRLSCQVRVRSNLVVRPIMTVSETGMEPGPTPSM
ncbi:2Fe-2S iron-sulfur cluster-binding protein [Thermicanus aegyptius]|uniref:2Fe-2S iron-sulfur cluster-binding protein n=1 Tax=Thermicanus aegyptius TaxID=94009 RepID=UPI000403C4F4|nr:2Fe-2S iron-sulfur cluster-binding protein [Thermicanus aegyptius]